MALIEDIYLESPGLPIKLFSNMVVSDQHRFVLGPLRKPLRDQPSGHYGNSKSLDSISGDDRKIRMLKWR